MPLHFSQNMLLTDHLGTPLYGSVLSLMNSSVYTSINPSPRTRREVHVVSRLCHAHRGRTPGGTVYHSRDIPRVCCADLRSGDGILVSLRTDIRISPRGCGRTHRIPHISIPTYCVDYLRMSHAHISGRRVSSYASSLLHDDVVPLRVYLFQHAQVLLQAVLGSYEESGLILCPSHI